MLFARPRRRPKVQATTQTKPRLASLDLLRLLAIVLVLGRHMEQVPPYLANDWNAILAIWYRGGWVGVDVFFVLSGFLVSGLLFAECKARGRISIGRFYMRRGWKIYPPFFVLIGVTLLANASTDTAMPTSAIASEVFFLQSYVQGLWNHTWSLAVEEHFYLLLPLVLLLVLRMKRAASEPLKPVITIAAYLAAGSLLLRLLHWYYRPSFSYLDDFFASHLRLDSLFFGVVISYAYHFHTDRFVTVLSAWRRWLIGGGLLCLTPAFMFAPETTPFIYTAGFTLFYLGSGMLMVGVLLSRPPRSRIMAVTASLGAYSYSIYLWHMPVARWGALLVSRAFDIPLGYADRAVIYVFGSVVAGVVMAKLIEVPALRLRDAWFPRTAAGPIEESSAPSP
jgi:peptidoglycan/LPS O-acetylase OafA/YrhL